MTGLDVDECATSTHDCDTDAQCTNTDGSLECSCNDEFIGDGINCAASSCHVFTVACKVTDGFEIIINEDCKKAKYPQLPSDNRGLFVYASDLDTNDDLDFSKVPDKCKFDDQAKLEFDFADCGASSHTSPDDGAYTVFTTYAHHRLLLGSTLTSLMDQITLECRLSHINLDSSDSDLTDNNEVTGLDTISSDALTTEFGLELVVGVVRNQEFKELTAQDKVDVGQEVSVQLETIKTSYLFSLSDCKASVDSTTIDLYDGVCPNKASQLVSLAWTNFVSFQISVFRVGDSSTLTFSCTVAVYPDEDDMPAECGSKRRRRQAEEPEKTGQVSVTIQIADGKKATGAGYTPFASIILQIVLFFTFAL